MTRPARKAVPATERLAHKSVATPSDSAGKADEQKCDAEVATTKVFVPIVKANIEEQTITGIVLQPEVVDAQGDIISADVIRNAAHKFLAAHNRATKLGLMHKDFKKRFELFESYVTPVDLVIGDSHVKAGSWIIIVHVLDKKVWEQVKAGKLTGFSIGGKAKVSKINPKAA